MKLLDFLLGTKEDKIQKALSLAIEVDEIQSEITGEKKYYDEEKKSHDVKLFILNNRLDVCKSEEEKEANESVKNRIEQRFMKFDAEFEKSIIDKTKRVYKNKKELSRILKNKEINNIFKAEFEKQKVEKSYDIVERLYKDGDLPKKQFKKLRKNAEKELDKQVHYADAIVTNDNGEVLLLKRREDDDMFSGKWCLPGGHVDPGEDSNKAVLRELHEETIIEIGDCTHAYTLDKEKALIDYFKCFVYGRPQVVIDLKEHEDYEWALIEKLSEYNLIGDLHNVFEQIFGSPKPVNIIVKSEEAFDKFEQLKEDSAYLVLQVAYQQGSISQNEFEKAQRTYIDNRENRRLNRVGQLYGSPEEEKPKGGSKKEKKDTQGGDKDKPIEDHARSSSDNALEQASKSGDEKLRVAAKKELERRHTEHHEEGDSNDLSEGKSLDPKFQELNKKFSLSRLPVGIPVDQVKVNEDGKKGNWILQWVDPKTGKRMDSYSKEFLERNAQEKWNRIKQISSGDINNIKKEAVKLLKSDDDKVSQSAAIISIIVNTGLRPGSRKGFNETENRGVTTLSKENIKISGDKVLFEFRGKSYKNNTAEVVSRPLAEYLSNLIEGKKEGDFIFDVDDNYVRSSFSQITAGKDIKIKDIRTYAATDLARKILLESHTPPPPIPEKGVKTALKKKLTEVFKEVSSQLNNTPAMAKSSYVLPDVINNWMETIGVKEGVLMKGLSLDKISSQSQDLDEFNNEDVDEYPLPDWWDDEEDVEEIEKSSRRGKLLPESYLSIKEILLSEEPLINKIVINDFFEKGELNRNQVEEMLEVVDQNNNLIKSIKYIDEGIEEDLIEKAKKDLSKLNKIQKLVQKDGKIFMQTYYVKTGEQFQEEKDKDKSQVIDVDQFVSELGEVKQGDTVEFVHNGEFMTGVVTKFGYKKSGEYFKLGIEDDKSGATIWKRLKKSSKLRKIIPEVKETPGNFDDHGYEILKNLGGSTGAKLVQKDGVLYVKKTASSPEHLSSEMRALKYYDQAGVETPKVHEYFKGDAVYLEYITGKEVGKTKKDDWDISPIGAINGFVMSALSMNWDSVGLEGDNIIVHEDNGTHVYVDVGGSFGFRAQGAPKGEWDAWAGVDKVSELDSMLNYLQNYQSASYYHNVIDNLYSDLIQENLLDLPKEQFTKNLIIETLKDIKLNADWYKSPATPDAQKLKNRLDKALKDLTGEHSGIQQTEPVIQDEEDVIKTDNILLLKNLYDEEYSVAFEIGRIDIQKMYNDLFDVMSMNKEEQDAADDIAKGYNTSTDNQWAKDNGLLPRHAWPIARHKGSTDYSFGAALQGVIKDQYNFNVSVDKYDQELSKLHHKKTEEKHYEIQRDILRKPFKDLSENDKTKRLRMKCMVEAFALAKKYKSRDFMNDATLYRGFGIDSDTTPTFNDVGNVIITPTVLASGIKKEKSFSGNTRMVMTGTEALNITECGSHSHELEAITKPFHMYQINSFSAKYYKGYSNHITAMKIGSTPNKFV